MQLTYLTCVLFLLMTSHWAVADEEKSTDTNEIIPREAIQKLDFSVRLALLRAIDKLELEAREGDDDEDISSQNENKTETTTDTPYNIIIQTTTAQPLNAQSKDEILEESTSSSDIFPAVQFFTATYDDKHNREQPLSIFIDKSKNKNFGSPVEVSNHIKDETKISNQAARSVSKSSHVQSNEISSNGFDEIKFEIRNAKGNQKVTTPTEVVLSKTTSTTTTTPRPRTTKRPTTTTTTTTTTPRPTHNEDGENIEVVAKDDIRIQAAPLVSAFTVDLDELGAAKKVIPIIDNPPSTVATVSTSTPRISSIFQPPLFGPTITELNVLHANAQRSQALNLVHNSPPAAAPTQSTLTSSTVSNVFANNAPTSGHFITKQPFTTNLNLQPPQQQPQQQQSNNVNNYLFEKQRELEQQIYQLKLQAQQQQELIIRQLKLLEEQAKQKGSPASIQQSTNTHLQQPQLQQQQQQQQPLHLSLVQQKQQEPGFTIRPSVEFIPSTQSKIAPIFSSFSLEQQLPLKESNGKYITGLQQQQQNNRFSNNIVQPPSQQQQQQRLPIDNNPIQQVFQNLQNLQKPNTQTAASISSIQIQPSNQLNIAPTFASLLPQMPAELSLVQALPQHNYQQFQQNPLIPQYVTDAILERQQQHNRARLFRQEGDTSNFGLNQLQTQTSSNGFPQFNQQQQQQQQQLQTKSIFDNQNFYRQHLIPEFSNQLQQNAQQFYQQHQQQQNSQTVLALNHGINNFAPQPPLSPSQASVAGTQPLLAQSARFNSNIF